MKADFLRGVLFVTSLWESCSAVMMFENVALNKPCSMSLQQHETAGCGGAVNGNTGGVYMSDGSNCIHTNGRYNSSWWQVNLGRPYPVYSITIWARGQNFLKRMVGVEITVDGQLCYRFNATPDQRQIPITCTSGVLNGTIIRLSKNASIQQFIDRDHTINICEFEVLSCSDGYWGSGCDRRCGNCSNSEVCDKVTGHCSSCPPGWKPPLCHAAEPLKEDKKESKWIIIGALVSAVVVLAVVVVILLFLYMRRRTSRHTNTAGVSPTNTGNEQDTSTARTTSTQDASTQRDSRDSNIELQDYNSHVYERLQNRGSLHQYSNLQIN